MLMLKFLKQFFSFFFFKKFNRWHKKKISADNLDPYTYTQMHFRHFATAITHILNILYIKELIGVGVSTFSVYLSAKMKNAQRSW